MRKFLTRLLVVSVAALPLYPSFAEAAPGPDLKVTTGCQLDPTNGPTAISCVINVSNIGNIPSVSPVTIIDNPSGPAGTTFTSHSGTFGCTTPTGPLPSAINCGAPLVIGPTQSGSTFLYFKLPPQGGTFTNCATATQGQNAATLPDPDPTNNTKICTSINVKGNDTKTPPDLSLTKSCTKGANSSLTCTITVKNNGAIPTVAPLTIVDTISPVLQVTTLTGASGNVSCPGAGPVTQPITCSAQPIAAGGTMVMLLSFKVTGKGTFSQCAKVQQGGPVAEANLANNSSCVKVTMP